MLEICSFEVTSTGWQPGKLTRELTHFNLERATGLSKFGLRDTLQI